MKEIRPKEIKRRPGLDKKIRDYNLLKGCPYGESITVDGKEIEISYSNLLDELECISIGVLETPELKKYHDKASKILNLEVQRSEKYLVPNKRFTPEDDRKNIKMMVKAIKVGNKLVAKLENYYLDLNV